VGFTPWPRTGLALFQDDQLLQRLAETSLTARGSHAPMPLMPEPQWMSQAWRSAGRWVATSAPKQESGDRQGNGKRQKGKTAKGYSEVLAERTTRNPTNTYRAVGTSQPR